MTADEARALFSAAYDRMLTPAQRRDFDAALAAEPAIAQEYHELSELLDAAHALDESTREDELGALLDEAREVVADDERGDDPPDLLQGVQGRLRARSAGRFYRDRFSQKAGLGATLPILLGVVMLLIIGISWLMLHRVVVDATQAAQRSGGPP